MIISNSDIDQFQQCERKFYYSRVLELIPLELPMPMQIGTFGHTMMEEFFKVILAGGSYEDASLSAGQCLIDVIDNPMMGKVYRHVLAFGAYFLNQPWKVVALEEKGSFPVTDDLEFGFTPDLIIEFTEGPLKGQQAVLDYKFTGQYWNDRELNMSQQIPKYIIYKNERDGTKIHRGAVVMLNTRAGVDKTGNDLFIIKWLPITKAKLATIKHENEVMMKRIEPYFSAELGDVEQEVIRTVNKNTCKMCWFADDLCPMDLNGQDTKRVIARNYKKNDYGYSDLVEDKKL